jgi:hypothetical protein
MPQTAELTCVIGVPRRLTEQPLHTVRRGALSPLATCEHHPPCPHETASSEAVAPRRREPPNDPRFEQRPSRTRSRPWPSTPYALGGNCSPGRVSTRRSRRPIGRCAPLPMLSNPPVEVQRQVCRTSARPRRSRRSAPRRQHLGRLAQARGLAPAESDGGADFGAGTAIRLATTDRRDLQLIDGYAASIQQARPAGPPTCTPKPAGHNRRRQHGLPPRATQAIVIHRGCAARPLYVTAAGLPATSRGPTDSHGRISPHPRRVASGGRCTAWPHPALIGHCAAKAPTGLRLSAAEARRLAARHVPQS